ncbi:MAG: helix-turn-helix domain-containing protein [Candidatus Binataceae bacterium]
MAARKERSFGELIRVRRRELDLTQEVVAQRIGASAPYVGHLESGKRHPSEQVVTQLAQVLGIDGRELYFLANPRARDLVEPKRRGGGGAAWERFRRDERLKKLYHVTQPEMEVLARVAQLGEIRSVDGFIHILNTVRYALSH